MSKIVPPTKAYLNSLVDPFLTTQPSGLAFVIGYVGPGFADIFYKGNLANQFGKRVALNQDTYFELASISKTFTATLSAALGQKYLPAWETQTIGNYNGTGGFRVGSQFNGIPLSTLLSYSSGLPADNVGGDDWPPYFPTPYSAAGMLGYLSMTPLTPVAPNTVYAYSNMAFGIMAQILPLFSTSSTLPDFTTLMSENVLTPLGMNHTYFFESISIDEFALGYSYYGVKSGNPGNPVPPGWDFFDAWYGAGGVVSTPKDMLTWLKFNMGLIDDRADKALFSCLPTLQSPATTVTTNPKGGGDNLGLGWFLTPPNDTFTTGLVWKDGEITGTNTFINFLPWTTTGDPTSKASDAGVFVMTNCDSLMLGGTEVVATIADDVILTMQGLTPPADKSKYPSVFGRN
jgi:serine-type D-Ala-D-Ala carboxypeptidase/endopeptidase